MNEDNKLPTECRILCSSRCKHNSGDDYYNICNHPNQDRTPYGMIERIYTEGCKLKEL